VNTQFAAIWDSDIIIHPRQIKASLSLVNHNTPLVLPYNGICYNVPEYISEKFKESKNIEIFYRYTDLMSLMNPYRVVGGAFIVDVAEYKKAGWENEHFIGWGPEDAERIRRLFILGKNIKRVNGKMFHLSHPKMPIGVDERYIAYITKREFCKVCGMKTDALIRYIKTWEWIYD